MDEIAKLKNNNEAQPCDTILTGDINRDQTNWGALSSTNLYEIQTLDMIVEINLTQYAPTQLDLSLCNNPELVTACTLEDTATQYLKQFSHLLPLH